MGLFKNTILGTGAAIVSVATAYAADLPSRKAAPVEYVRICDAYGAGFFYIPGTQTCLRIGGRVRADYSFVAAQKVYSGIVGVVPTISVYENGQHTVGWEARARITFDARTQTSWGVVQTAAALRLARTTGVVGSADVNTSTGTSTSAGSTLESAYIRFAGFTFGASRDNFAMMPSLTYGAGHWGSFANGAKQIAYTANFGGGFSATIALQDLADTQSASTFQVDGSVPGNARYVYNSLPNIVGRLDLQQGWGELSLAGAVATVSASNNTLGPINNFSEKQTVWAATIGARFNLPMLAQGSKLYLTAAYADGMTEYTTNWSSFKSSAYQRDVGGYTMNHPSVVFEGSGLTSRIETVKSWNVAALLEHYWTPQYRSVLFATYGSLDAPITASARAWNGTSGFGDAKVFNIGTNFAWIPTKDFEIGVEVIYARVSQDVRNSALVMTSQSDNNLSGRLRVERTF